MCVIKDWRPFVLFFLKYMPYMKRMFFVLCQETASPPPTHPSPIQCASWLNCSPGNFEISMVNNYLWLPATLWARNRPQQTTTTTQHTHQDCSPIHWSSYSPPPVGGAKFLLSLGFRAVTTVHPSRPHCLPSWHDMPGGSSPLPDQYGCMKAGYLTGVQAHTYMCLRLAWPCDKSSLWGGQ